MNKVYLDGEQMISELTDRRLEFKLKELREMFPEAIITYKKEGDATETTY